MAFAGTTESEKVDEGVIVRAAVEVALCVPTVTVKGPVAAPAGITIEMCEASKVATGPAMVPPPCLFKDT